MFNLGLGQVKLEVPLSYGNKVEVGQLFSKHQAQYKQLLTRAEPQTSEASSTGLSAQNGAGSYTTQCLSTEQLEEIQNLIKVANESDLVELKLSSPRFKLTLRKKEAIEMEENSKLKESFANNQNSSGMMPNFYNPSFMQGSMQQMQQQPQQLQPSSQPSEGSASTQPAPPPQVQEEKLEGNPVSCPIAGTFYRSPSPNEPAFVKEGDFVKKGQVVCIVEAMKMMNEIEAEQDGTVVKFVAQNHSIVRPGDTLLLLK